MGKLKTTLTATSLLAFTLITLASVPAHGNALVTPPAQNLPVPSQRFGNLQKAEDPSFRRHVIPLLARVGCSARECHGSFQGRGGFQLSLFGSEWEQDFTALTQKKGDEEQTHINAANPEKSLILLKPTLQMKHKGK